MNEMRRQVENMSELLSYLRPWWDFERLIECKSNDKNALTPGGRAWHGGGPLRGEGKGQYIWLFVGKD
jgi:hypothetical protein